MKERTNNDELIRNKKNSSIYQGKILESQNRSNYTKCVKVKVSQSQYILFDLNSF
jgi:hypothetical protein